MLITEPNLIPERYDLKGMRGWGWDQDLTYAVLRVHAQGSRSGFNLSDDLLSDDLRERLSWCPWRSGTTPIHLELGCETLQRRRYLGGSPLRK